MLDGHAVIAVTASRDLSPGDAVEKMLAEQVVAAAWRLQRAMRAQREHLESYRQGETSVDLDLVWGYYDRQSDRLSLHEQRLERAMHRALGRLTSLQEARRRRAAANGLPALRWA